MSTIWTESLPGRLLRWLLFVWQGSLLCRGWKGLQRAWQNACIHRLLQRAMGSESRALQASRFAGAITGINRWLNRRTHLRQAVHGSTLARLYGAILRVCSGSRIVGWAFQGGMSRLLLLVLALYVPLDWLLRDVLPIPLLGSVWDELLLLFCTAWALWMRVDGKTELRARVTPMHLPILLFLVIGMAEMLLTNPYWSISVTGYRATVQYILWFFVVVSLLRNDGDFFTVYLGITLAGAVIALHGIYQYIVAVPIPDTWMSSSEEYVRTRAFSIFGSPNILGDFMVMTAPLAAGLFFYWKDWRLKLLSAAVTGCMCFACLFTMSRGAWIGMVVAVLCFVALVDRRLLVAAIVACVCALFVPFVWNRVSYLFSEDFWYLSNNGGRTSRWALGIKYLYRTNPVLGMGLGMWGGAVAMQHQILHWVWYTYMDSYHLRIFVEMGWVGLAAYAVMMLSLLLTGVRGWYRNRQAKRERALIAGLLAGLAGVLSHCFFENIFEEPYMMACFWILAALLCWLCFLRRRGREA